MGSRSHASCDGRFQEFRGPHQGMLDSDMQQEGIDLHDSIASSSSSGCKSHRSSDGVFHLVFGSFTIFLNFVVPPFISCFVGFKNAKNKTAKRKGKKDTC